MKWLLAILGLLITGILSGIALAILDCAWNLADEMPIWWEGDGDEDGEDD